jgi:saccharopine dehydrogenase (NAD+, L-lysine-forming)
MKIGIIKEGKTPPDRRVPLSPKHCEILLQRYPSLEIAVQPSDIRAFKDSEYQAFNIPLQDDLSDCDLLLGVKEVPINMLLPHKRYMFFSHTYKKQEYNRDLLKAILAKKVSLIDYEMLKDPGGKRLLGFGRYAGIVGCYNGFRAYGKLSGQYDLKPAHLCHDRLELESELVKVVLPKNFRIAISGAGRVAGGAMEILSALKITQVYPDEFIREDFNQEAVYTQLNVQDYFRRCDGKDFKRKDFYQDSEGYESNFLTYAAHADMYVACHYWSEESPFIFDREMARDPNFNIKLVADISCDIDGPVASTIRPSTIADPFYAYNPISEKEVALGTEGSIAVSAVDNLPGELPRDASEDFGNELLKNVIPHFFNEDELQILDKATETTLAGNLNSHYSYLEDYIA